MKTLFSSDGSQALTVSDLRGDAAALRQQLLSCISAGGSQEEVYKAIELLAPFNPTENPARSELLQGNWTLLWSSDAAEVTKVPVFISRQTF